MASGPHYYRRVIRIRAEDSPNVRYAMAEGASLQDPGKASNTMIVPGCLSWRQFVKRRLTWDPIRQCIGLDALFYLGQEVFLYPELWLDNAALNAENHLRSGLKRRARAIGIDPAEGGDKTAMAAGDEYGLIELVSKKTPDTSVIPNDVLAFARKHCLIDQPERWIFDRGGGGKEHADRLRARGYKGVRTVAFGESLVLYPKRGLRPIEQRVEMKEEQYVYRNRRAEMYGTLRLLLDPSLDDPTSLGGDFARLMFSQNGVNGAKRWPGFGIPKEYTELRRQLLPIPLLYDGEGRLRMLPKNKRSPDSQEKTLVELLGCSPDEADAVVLMVHGMTTKSSRVKASVG